MLLAAPQGEAGSQVGTGPPPAVLRPAGPPAGSFSIRAGSDNEAFSVALWPLLPPLPVASMRSMANLAFHPPVCAGVGGGCYGGIREADTHCWSTGCGPGHHGARLCSPWPLPEPLQSSLHLLAYYPDLIWPGLPACHFLIVLL